MTIYIILITCLVSIAAFRSEELTEKLVFNPYKVKHQDEWHRLLTSGFIHANWIHLFVNMFVLYSFGTGVEHYYGLFFGERSPYFFLILYIGAILISILPTYNKQKENPLYNALGASGAVSAVLFAFILFRPLQPLYIWGLLPIPGIVLGVAYLAYSYYESQKADDHINHDAHFWGAMYGIVLTLIFEPKLAVYFVDQLRAARLEDFIHH